MEIILLGIYFLIWFLFYKVFGAPDVIFIQTDHPVENNHIALTVLSSIIIAPVIETLIFQFLLPEFFLLGNKFQNNEWLIILVCSIIFGLLHFYSLSYIIVTTITGAFFVYAYLLKKNCQGYWLAVILHASVNALALVLMQFE